MTGVIDVGIGNVGSLLNMLDHIGAPARVVTGPGDLAAVSRLILPGVGAFDRGMARLHDSGMIDGLTRRVLVDRVPLLGICLGMQMLGRASEEGSRPGLGWLAATTRRFDLGGIAERLRLPHMGWNECRPASSASIVDGSEGTPRYYFAHSYHVVCDDPGLVAGWTHHGRDFAAAVQQGNVYGVQFHPEKSHRWGKQLLQRFARLV